MLSFNVVIRNNLLKRTKYILQYISYVDMSGLRFQQKLADIR